MLYEPRESINPRAFALRHALLEELKLRQRRASGDAERERLAALARALDLAYDAATRHFTVRAGEARVEVPLDAFRFFEARTDAATAQWRREDEVLQANRALAAGVIDQLSAAPPADRAP